ncbi:MAG TPA: OsmC family protein [Polyangiaceae bacterium]|nr:OsmC family protein [Polyangiaceae bacterium]
MKFTLNSAGGVASRVTLGSHELVFDQPSAVPGGTDRGPSPLDVLAVAVGACAHYYAAAFLTARQMPTDGLTVEIEAEKSRQPVTRLGTFLIHVKLPAGVSLQHLPAIERAIRHCPAYGTLVHPPDVTLVVSPHEGEKARVA